MLPHLMDPPAVPLPLRESVQQIEVLMVSIYEQGGEGLFLQPVQPVLIFGASVPQPSEVSRDDHIVLTAHVLLLGDVFAPKPLESAVGVACNINRHLITSLPAYKVICCCPGKGSSFCLISAPATVRMPSPFLVSAVTRRPS